MYYLHFINIIQSNIEYDMDEIRDEIPDKVLYTGHINDKNQFRIRDYIKRKVQFLENWNKVIGFQVIILVISLLSDS